MPDTSQSAEALLADVERRLDAVDAGLLTAEPTGLEAASGDLRHAARAFAVALGAALSAEAFDHSLRRRIEAIAQRLTNQREHMARRHVVVVRTLASILRPPVDITYTRPGESAAYGASR